jgi:hypothetical protein
MKIYHYENNTGEFIGFGYAKQSPLEPGVFLIPANATSMAPPQVSVGYVAAFRDGSWQTTQDNRGTWYDSSGAVVVISEIGLSAEGLTKEPPPPTLDEIKAGVQAANRSACRVRILAKYTEETQRNAALGIYGEEYAATCADFIARCIAVEDAAFDAVEACTTAEELADLPAIVFPEV